MPDIDKELEEIESAPKVPISALMPHTTGEAGRCHWCGRHSEDRVYVDTVHGRQRYKGVKCCGGRHV